MGFANPARPIDYELIGSIGSVDYELVRQAADQALASTDVIVAQRQPSPVVPSWSATRLDNLAAMLAVQAAINAVTAQRATTPDESSAALAVVNDLQNRRAALWALVKTP